MWNVLTWKKVVLKDATLGQPHLSMQLTLLASPSVFIPPRKFCLHQTLCPTIRPVGTQHVLLQCPLLSSGGHTTPLFKSFDYQPSLCEYFQIFFGFFVPSYVCKSSRLSLLDCNFFYTALPNFIFFALPHIDRFWLPLLLQIIIFLETRAIYFYFLCLNYQAVIKTMYHIM